ncbi:MAG TPA: cation-translocating P-type ATPase C-terminal domain-containing protein, partial [Kineosporiaceae bacterium]|nr:cation-translocating P-type ATPase C-terminal domain-containing protein [Kineosporiaceae bacterium]
FLPLQTLWMNFTTQIFQSIGLGYGRPAPGLMQRKPRPVDQPILSRDQYVWLSIVGLVVGVGTLGVIAWAEHTSTLEVARTMGLTTFSLFCLLRSLTVKDEVRSVFSLDTFDDPRFLQMTGLSAGAIVFATELGLFQKILKTESLDLNQWLICLVVSLSIIVVSEIRKFVLRRRLTSTAPAKVGGAHPATA